MSIIQALIGSVSGGSAPDPYYNPYRSGSMGEGSTVDIRLDYEYSGTSRIYWSIIPDPNYSAAQQVTLDTDITSSNGWNGYVDVTLGGSGYSILLTTITNVADHLTEDYEYYALRLGTSPNGSDLGFWGGWNVNDLSQSTGYGWGTVSGSMAFNSTGKYVSYTHANLAAGTGEFAFEGLFYIKSAANGGHTNGKGFLLGQGDVNTWSDPNGLNIYVENNQLNVIVCGISHDSPPTVSDLYDTWARISVARTAGGYVRIRINGSSPYVSSSPLDGNLTSTRFDLGAQQRLIANVDANYIFSGYMTNIHFNTNATYVNNKFNSGSAITDDPWTIVSATTGTQLLLNANDTDNLIVDSSNNALGGEITNGGPSWSRKTSYMAPQLWLDGYYSESYDGTSGFWRDLGSTGKDARLYNTTFDDTYKAVVFDSRAGSYAEGNNLGQDTYNTVSVWVRPENFGGSWPPTGPNSPAIFTETYPGSTNKIGFTLAPNLTFDYSNTNKIYGGNYSGSWYITSPGYSASAGNWYHITLTQGDNESGSAPSQKLYVNGQLVASGTSAALYSSGGVYRIARRWDGTQFFPGMIGSVQKFNHALSASQVTALYNSQKTRFLPPTASYTMSDSGTVTEGTQVVYTVTTTNVDDGTTMYYWKKSGTAVAADVDSLSGTFTVNSNAGQFSITPTNDYLTEGIDTLTIAIGVVNGTELYSDQLVINNNTSTPPSLYEIVTYNLVGPASDGYAWPSVRLGDSQTVYSMVHGSWSRDGDYQGGAIFTNNTWVEMPVNVATNQFSISLIADFTTNSGWNSVFSTGDLTEGSSGTGYHCYYITGSGDDGTISIVTNYNGTAKYSRFTCTQSDFGTRSHWAFVINTSGGSDATQIYRNGVALTKTESNLITPDSYGDHTLCVGTRRQNGSTGYDTISGTIYRIHAAPTAWSQMQAQAEYGSLTSLYGL